MKERAVGIMDFFGAHSPKKPLSNFDTELQDFYHKLLSIILEREKTSKVVIETLKQERIRRIQKVNSKSALKNTAYLFRYGPCYTSAVANHLLQMIEENPSIFHEALAKRCVNICCFGSASIIEIVAICKIFSLVQDSFWKSTQKLLQIIVTVIGNDIGQWKKTVNYELQVLLETKSIFDSTKMIISAHFSKTNQVKILNNTALDFLYQADLVTMVKFASMVRLETVTQQLLWEVANSMKGNGVLFFLETGMFPHCRLFQTVLEPFNDIQSIFGPKNIEPFTLSINSIQKCVKLFWSKFQHNICLTSCIVNSAAWIKTEPIAEIRNKQVTKKEKQEKIMKAKREWCEKQILSDKTLEDYHQKVRQVLPKKNTKKQTDEDNTLSYFLDNYPKIEKSILFKSKSKEKRIYLR